MTKRGEGASSVSRTLKGFQNKLHNVTPYVQCFSLACDRQAEQLNHCVCFDTAANHKHSYRRQRAWAKIRVPSTLTTFSATFSQDRLSILRSKYAFCCCLKLRLRFETRCIIVVMVKTLVRANARTKYNQKKSFGREVAAPGSQHAARKAMLISPNAFQNQPVTAKDTHASAQMLQERCTCPASPWIMPVLVSCSSCAITTHAVPISTEQARACQGAPATQKCDDELIQTFTDALTRDGILRPRVNTISEISFCLARWSKQILTPRLYSPAPTTLHNALTQLPDAVQRLGCQGAPENHRYKACLYLW